MNANTGTLTVGPITLEPAGDDFTDAGPGSVWGVNRSNGDAVFITLELGWWAEQNGTPWSASLWRGWEDGTRAPRGFGEPRYATRDAALAAIRRQVAARL